MLAITHLIASLVLVQLLSLDRNDAFVALLFGVFIDVDHLFGLERYVHANGVWSMFDFDSLMVADGHWKSLLHNPVAVMVVGPLSVASRLAIPLVFWSLHVTMDFVEDAFLGVFSYPEAVLLCLISMGLVTLRYSKYLESNAFGDFWRYLRSEWSAIRSLGRSEGGAGL